MQTHHQACSEAVHSISQGRCKRLLSIMMRDLAVRPEFGCYPSIEAEEGFFTRCVTDMRLFAGIT